MLLRVYKKVLQVSSTNKWPKTFPALTEEQKNIADDFVAHWHTVLPSCYSLIDRFNHKYPVKNSPREFIKTLEIGAGLGEHLKYEILTQHQRKNYLCIDIRENMVAGIHRFFPDVKAIV